MIISDRDEVRARLRAIRRRWRVVNLLHASARAAAVAAAPLLVAGAVYAWLAPGGAALITLVAAAAALACAAGAFVCARVPWVASDVQVARYVEEQAGGGRPAALDDVLVSAVQVIEKPGQHDGFAGALVGRAAELLREIDASSVVSRRAVGRALFAAAGGAVVLALALAVVAPAAQRAGAAAWVRYVPGSVVITVLTGDVRVPAGGPLRIRAKLQGRVVRMLAITPVLVVEADGQQRSVVMTAAEGGTEHEPHFEFDFASIDRSFEYRVTAGDARSQPYAVSALFPPRVSRIDLHYTYPAFTRLGARTEEDGGDIFAPAGTRVRIVVHTDRPVTSGRLALVGGKQVPLAPAAASAVSGDIVIGHDDAYRIVLGDGDGVGTRGEVEYFIRVMDDRPPDVRILRPAADQGITPLEEVVVEARAQDDHGVAQFDLVYSVAGREPRRVPFGRVTGTETEKSGSYLLAAEDLEVRPGDVVTVYARARDVAWGRPSTEVRSDLLFIEVKPFNEEFVAAQSQGMASGGGTPIDALIAAQKEIISATWNLERRAVAGRSAEDLAAVGRAQAELKARVERMVGSGPGPGRGAFPPQQALPFAGSSRRGTPDAMRGALEAMARAVEQLEHRQGAEAIPHEMAALQGLLQAQAEVRRRQVMMQQATGGGAGGTGRTDRDLSALFDRELQRQQRTVYETPPQAQEEASNRETGSDAMDRVRDLARRQEELARQQRDLSSARTPEEARRQLERLSREQQQLRRDLDELQQAMRREAGASQRSSTADARAAAEAMQASADEMQRHNAEGAAAGSARAATALRQLERHMRSGSTDARQRAAGDLRLEAQQLAEAQRRLAAEAARNDPAAEAGERGRDARRRLAVEQDALADRADTLERTARQLEGDMPGGAGERFGTAARRLREGRIAERMRASARELRETGRQNGGAADRNAREELAQALDAIVEALGGAAHADARRLIEALDRTGEMRSRLERLERAVREAERRAAVETNTATGPPEPHEQRSAQANSEQRSGQASNEWSAQAGNEQRSAQADNEQRSGQASNERSAQADNEQRSRQTSNERSAPANNEQRSGQASNERSAQADNEQRSAQAGNEQRSAQANNEQRSAQADAASRALSQAREAYARELERTRDALGRMQGDQRGLGGATPEHHEYSRSAPGTEAFKQDFTPWEVLRKEIDTALDAYEANVAAALAGSDRDDRLTGGGSDRVPDTYRRAVSRYFEAIAEVKK